MAPPADDVALVERFDFFRRHPADSAIVTDFDGTLSTIVDDPAAARPVPGLVDVIHELAGCYGRVAVVSGRPVKFLRDRLDVDRRPDRGLILSGLYGLEWLEGGVARTEDTAMAFGAVVDEVAGSAELAAPEGVVVERKGLSVTLHVRTAPQHTGWARSWAESTATTHGLAVHEGRCSFELRPPLEVDKGTVVASLVEGRRAACFLGDDHGDLPAFAALDDLAARTGATVVKVGVRSPEAPRQLLERADLLVEGPLGSLELLSRLL